MGKILVYCVYIVVYLNTFFISHYQLPVFFSVQIQDEADKNVIAKNIIVEIVSQPIVKSFVGGYRNTKTGDYIYIYQYMWQL